MPSHQNYFDLIGRFIIPFGAGDVTCLATVPVDMEVEAHFIAKEDGVIAGIALAEMIFGEVDPSLKVWLFSYDFHLIIVLLLSISAS